MDNYRKMYMTLLDSVVWATDILIKAQQTCEELYILAEEKERAEIRLIKKG